MASEVEVLFCGFKNSEICCYADEARRAFMIELEFDETVIKYYQPRMELLLKSRGGKIDLLNIDFWVTKADDVTEFVHIHKEESLDPDILYKAIENSTAVKAEFKAIRANDLLVEPRKSNLEKLWKEAQREVKNIHTAFLNTFFRETSNPIISDLKFLLVQNGLAPELAETLIFRKAVFADLDNFPIVGDTPVMRNPAWINSPPAGGQEQFSFLEVWKGFDPNAEKESF